MSAVFVVLLALVILVDILLIILWKKKGEEYYSTKNLPTVSILVAARNEEHNIERCLHSLLQQDYPADKVQILVGDDDSKDETYTKAEALLSNSKNGRVIGITKTLRHQKGKANVLAHLANESTGEYLFITDADMELPKTWLRNMVLAFDESTAIVTGVTSTENVSYQGIEWVFALGMVKVLNDLNFPVITMGNNMVISRRAYFEVGGYENIPFSITEDLQLFKEVRAKGYGVKQLYNPNVLGLTKPMEGFFDLLEQRKRWMQGAVQLPWAIVTILFIQAVYFPSILALTILQPMIGISLMIFKTVIQVIFLNLCAKRLKMEISIIRLVLYEYYSWLYSSAVLFYYFIPRKVSWKGRKY